MPIVKYRDIDMGEYGEITNCYVHCIHVIIDEDIYEYALEIIKTISNTSWITELQDPTAQIVFNATSKKTIEKLTSQILKGVENKKIKEFGEYVVSLSAQDALVGTYNHSKIPIAEFIKDRLSGNGGFDFHTETHREHIGFGEAKYRSKETPHEITLKQIVDMIKDDEDVKELLILKNFVSEIALINARDKQRKSYIAAFSMKSDSDPDVIFKNALKSEKLKELLVHHEIYLIAIQIG